MIDETPSLHGIHLRYCAITGLNKPFTTEDMGIWRNFLALGFTVKDLEIVVAHLKRKLSGQRLLSAMKLRWLVRDTESFGEELAEARALARVPRQDPARLAVLRATGRETVKVPDNVRTPAQILAGENALKELLKLRDTL